MKNDLIEQKQGYFKLLAKLWQIYHSYWGGMSYWLVEVSGVVK